MTEDNDIENVHPESLLFGVIIFSMICFIVSYVFVKFVIWG